MVLYEIGFLDRAFVTTTKRIHNSRVEECTLAGRTPEPGTSTASDSGIDVVVSDNSVVTDF